MATTTTPHVIIPAVAKPGTKLPLSPREADVFLCILARMRIDGHAPTRSEISSDCGWADPSVATRHVCGLRDKGWIRMWPRRARGLVVV